MFKSRSKKKEDLGSIVIAFIEFFWMSFMVPMLYFNMFDHFGIFCWMLVFIVLVCIDLHYYH